MDIQLHYFISLAFTGIFNIHAYCYFTGGGYLLIGYFKVAIPKISIAQAMSEGEEGLAIEIHISESPGDIVLVLWWNLALSCIYGIRKLTSRIEIPKQHIGYCITHFFACPPCCYHCRGIVFYRRNCKRARVHFHYYGT